MACCKILYQIRNGLYWPTPSELPPKRVNGKYLENWLRVKVQLSTKPTDVFNLSSLIMYSHTDHRNIITVLRLDSHTNKSTSEILFPLDFILRTNSSYSSFRTIRRPLLFFKEKKFGSTHKTKSKA